VVRDRPKPDVDLPPDADNKPEADNPPAGTDGWAAATDPV
jgi:hypothetical protein